MKNCERTLADEPVVEVMEEDFEEVAVEVCSEDDVDDIMVNEADQASNDDEAADKIDEEMFGHL